MDLEKVEKETFIDLNGNERKQYCYELDYYVNDSSSDKSFDEIIQYVAYPDRISLCKFGSDDDVVITNLKSLLRDVKSSSGLKIKYVINFDELQTTTIWVADEVAKCTSEN